MLTSIVVEDHGGDQIVAVIQPPVLAAPAVAAYLSASRDRDRLACGFIYFYVRAQLPLGGNYALLPDRGEVHCGLPRRNHFMFSTENKSFSILWLYALSQCGSI